MKYENHCELFNDRSLVLMGKFIICVEGGVISLYSNAEFERALVHVEDADEVKTILRAWAKNKERMLARYGEHASIKHAGRICGGGLILAHGDSVYVAGKSDEYGPAEIEDVRGCLAGITVEHVQ